MTEEALAEEPPLRACRQKFRLALQDTALFCAEAHITTARFSEIEAGRAKPPALLIAYAWARVHLVEQALAMLTDALRGRITMVSERLPAGFELPEYDSESAPSYSAWQLPRLTLVHGRITQAQLVRDAELTHAYVSMVEHGKANLAPRLAIQYLTHLTSELSYVDSAVRAVGSARTRLAEVAPESGVQHAGGAGS